MKTNQYNEPDVIFLQLHDPTDEGKTELADPKADGVTWCWEQIHHNDVEYIRKDLYDDLKTQITAYQLTIANLERNKLSVFYGKMPESNGKSNWTAILYRKNEGELFGGIGDGITIERSEYPDRVRYEADRLRYLIGDINEKPSILDYDGNKHSGYVHPKEAEE